MAKVIENKDRETVAAQRCDAYNNVISSTGFKN
jgi:hypothetical protein